MLAAWGADRCAMMCVLDDQIELHLYSEPACGWPSERKCCRGCATAVRQEACTNGRCVLGRLGIRLIAGIADCRPGDEQRCRLAHCDCSYAAAMVGLLLLPEAGRWKACIAHNSWSRERAVQSVHRHCI